MRYKNSRNVITIQTKQKIIAKVANGHIVRHYGLNKTTAGAILAKKHVIKNTQAVKEVAKIPCEKHRCVIHEKMEKLLLMWIKESEIKGDVTSMAIIYEKAREIFGELKKQIFHSAYEDIEFKATIGWLAKFKKRIGIKRRAMHDEPGSAANEEADKFCAGF